MKSTTHRDRDNFVADSIAFVVAVAIFRCRDPAAYLLCFFFFFLMIGMPYY